MWHYMKDDGDDDNEDLLSRLKEDHTDWTETLIPEAVSGSDGNPWRRIWKEHSQSGITNVTGSPFVLQAATYIVVKFHGK